MIYFVLIIGVVVIFLTLFLYSILKDEDNFFQKQKKIIEESGIDILNEVKSSTIQKDIFYEGLNNINIENEKFKLMKLEINKNIIGMDNFINSILICILSGGNLLVEGVPGLAKTKTIDTVSKVLKLNFKRIQFTPDMLPSDIIGIEIFNSQTKEFEVKKGPVFTNILLADEINRATPKVQSALLEAMEEKQVSIGGVTNSIEKPFFVLATQNPLEQEGTYSLPEAQVDRFMFKVLVDYPLLHEEKKILDVIELQTQLNSIIGKQDLLDMQDNIKKVLVSNDIKDYITRIVHATRSYKHKILYGASPRASISIMNSSKALAFIQGRDYVIHEDVQKLALNVLRHRIILTYDAKVDGLNEDSVLLEILRKTTLE